MTSLPTGSERAGRLLRVERLVVPLVPEQAWLTTEQIQQALDAQGIDVFGLESVLKRLKRRGWLLWNRYNDPPGWGRTPSGSAAVEAILSRA